MSNTVENFINDFNVSLGEYLWPLPDPEQKLDPGSESIGFINLYRPTKKYSDWDIHCYLKPEYRKEEIIRKFESYIFSFKGFSNQGIFICKSPNLKSVWQHINNMNALQIMAFVENENFAPFFDFTLYFDDKELIQKMYSDISGESSIYWSFLTAWRKLKNVDIQKYLAISHTYIAPLLTPGVESETFLNDPNKFFRKKLEAKSYNEVVTFLTK